MQPEEGKGNHEDTKAQRGHKRLRDLCIVCGKIIPEKWINPFSPLNLYYQ